MAVFRHLVFLKVENFNCTYSLEGQNASLCQTVCRSVKPLRRYCRFSIFQEGGGPPSWICYMSVWLIHEEYLVVFYILSVKPEMPIYAPVEGVLGGKIGEIGNFL